MRTRLLSVVGIMLAVLCNSNIHSQDESPRWNVPMTYAWTEGKDYTPYLPVYRDVILNTVPRIVTTPYEVFLVNPNYRPFPHTATQSEMSIYVQPNNPGRVLGGWNSYGPSFYGTGFCFTTNGGTNWTGSHQITPAGVNGGDPSAVITSNGNLFMNALNSGYTTVIVSKSIDNGATWAPYVTVESGLSPDKNHMIADNVAASPYYNYLYCTWTAFGASGWPARFRRSTDLGATWVDGQQIGTPPSGHFSQGVNLQTGPTGQVYFFCATPTTSSPYTEDFIGFARSTNGGVSFSYINLSAIDINGIRGTLKSSPSIRVNAFPWAAVDKSGGPRNGWLYVTWAQKNMSPAGSDPDVCFSRSTDQGTTWSSTVRINNDAMNNGRDQWFPNITADPYGGLTILFYDSRNPTTNDSAEMYIARSADGGLTWVNELISDHRFRPKPISGLAGGYQGDYLGIASGGNKVHPFWMDDYSGIYQGWTTDINLGPGIAHTPLPNTENMAGPYVVNCVITPAGSAIDPARTKVYWSRNNPVTTDSITMTNTSGNNWTANIPGNGTASTYRYYIRTYDMLNRVATSPAGAPASLHMFLAMPDLTPPVITHTPLQDVPRSAWPATVGAQVVDNEPGTPPYGGIDSVWVRWYRNNTGTGIRHFRLSSTGGNNFSAAFNSDTSQVQYNDSIFYRVFAQDNSANHNRDSTALNRFRIVAIVNFCVGTGTTAVQYPYYTYWHDSRTQMLYTQSEIVGAGGSGGNITRIGFNVTVVGGQSMNNFNIRFQHTSAATLSGFVTSGWTTCYTGTYTVPGTGLQYVTLQTPFTYNGTSNLLVEICFDNASWTSSSEVQATSVPGRTWNQFADGAAGCSFAAGSGPALRPNLCATVNQLVGNENNQTLVPDVFSLAQNYPNPFNPTTTIKYAVPRQSMVKLYLFDILGREIVTLVNEVKTPGNYEVEFDASAYASGVYFYRMESGGFVDVKKMVLLK